MKYGSLCTGIGGLDLAAEAHFAATPAWHAEIEPAPCRVLERHWPGVPNLGDLTTLDWTQVPPVDVLTAGYPCQPFSTAGRRQGADDDRHLWPYIAEAVRVLRPRWVVLENVAGHLSLGFGEVLRDLAEAGFDAEWCVLRASDVGACHQRARLFIVARDASRVVGNGERGQRHDPSPAGFRHAVPLPARGGRGAAAPDADRMAGASPVSVAGRPGAMGEPRTVERALRLCGMAAAASVAWGRYEPAIRRWEHLLGRPAPAPTDDRGRLAPAFVEWMMGYPEGWVTGIMRPNVDPRPSWLSRTQALKALGNAVVPQQAMAALAELAPIVEAAA